MREFVFEVSIFAIVRVRAETEADARQALTSSVLGSPAANEIRLANEANFIEGKEGTITEVDFSIVDNSVSSGMSTRGRRVPPDRFPAIDSRRRLNADRERDNLPCKFGNFYPLLWNFYLPLDFPCIH